APEQRLGHLAPRRVAGAHEDDPDRRGRRLLDDGRRRRDDLAEGHGLRSSMRPVARYTIASPMLVTRSPIRSSQCAARISRVPGSTVRGSTRIWSMMSAKIFR